MLPHGINTSRKNNNLHFSFFPDKLPEGLTEQASAHNMQAITDVPGVTELQYINIPSYKYPKANDMTCIPQGMVFEGVDLSQFSGRQEDIELKPRQRTRRHTAKTYACEVCRKMYSTRQSLNVHMNIHTGQKPFKCDICETGFAHPYMLALHKQQHSVP
ncbi:unnamed protein product [Owenia fusiformis]|uniref:Uncharacterized protein n=1 Tax=Owenia fusiformis TaxID=6347 RepID=A0A8J1XKX0_OWEFU|nr:unnamed protein product [Owenia fusiformis]